MDHEVDISVFETRYRNDETRAPAYDLAIVLKIILYAYARGIISSREIEHKRVFRQLRWAVQNAFQDLAKGII